MEKKNKYDTNPLDPDVAGRADDAWGATRSSSTSTEEIRGGATSEVARTANEQARSEPGADAPTRRMDAPFLPESYPSVFIPPKYAPPPATYQSASAAAQTFNSPPTSRTIPGIGMPENLALVLPYIPFYIGAILGAVELFLAPRSEVRVRHHAAQGLSLHLVILVAGFVLRIARMLADNTLGGFASGMLGLASLLFSIATIVFTIICLIKVWKGDNLRIGPIAELTKWFNEHIEPKK
ncbi:MAG TPA: hypothetical protein VK619_08210 [Pyrinomonadaceae bacterium]|nr:hypothetical protein [Pyrinomonadaceae bacterium]